MALTASMKAAAIVSSSQQIKDYIAFVSNDATSSMTASYATMAGLAMSVYTPSGTANRVLYQAAGGGFSSTTTDSNFQWTAGSSTLSVGSLQILSSGRLQSSIDATNNISLHDGTLGIIKITNAGTDRITINRNPDTIVLSGSLVVDSNNPASVHQITGSLNVTGSAHTIQNGYVILQQVSQSLNFVDDTAAAAGNVPLGGLYRNGNFIVIRIV
jgi:hypothetical protein